MLWEYEFLIFLNKLVSFPWLDNIMLFITRLSDHGELWIGIGIVLSIIKPTRKVGLSVLLSLSIGLILGNLILKPIIARPRPFDIYEINLILTAPTDYSFPSGHTLASFEGAFAVRYRMKVLGNILIVIAALTAFSRLYLMVHYPTDILFGILLAFGISYFSDYIINRKKNILQK